jgi:hypothetical protein
MKTSQIVIAAVLGLALAGGGFAAGMTVGRGTGATTAGTSGSPAASAGVRGQGGAVFRGGQGASGAGGPQLVTGRVLSVNDGSITVEVRQPGQQGASPAVTSEIVLVGASTRIVRATETEIKTSDLKANDQIQIVGTTDASGNVAASAIVVGGNALQQVFGGGAAGGGGAPRGSASPSPR